jgi:hypothetical protein
MAGGRQPLLDALDDLGIKGLAMSGTITPITLDELS